MKEIAILKEVGKPLLHWYYKNRRALPWREEPTPYHVWVSEIMLQQTRVEAVKAYYNRFMEALPTIETLAAVEEDKLLKLWEGLGYYSRVKNMQKAAKQIAEVYAGKIPADYNKLLKLPGIGDYTAGAIASIAFGLPVAAVDGNVLRVLSRILVSYEDISQQATKKKWKECIEKAMPEKEAGNFNQAVMELGATVCVPNGEPKCEECPLNTFCLAYQQGIQMDLPVKADKKKRKIEEKIVFIIECDGLIAIRKREEKGLLAGLWEFPNVDLAYQEDSIRDTLKEWKLEPFFVKQLPAAKHIFTHKEWHMTGCFVRVSDKNGQFIWSSAEERKHVYSLPSAFRFYQKEIEERGIQ